MTNYLHFVVQDHDARNRIDWYDEIKTPLLTSLILCDTGKEALKDRQETLHRIMLSNMTNLGTEESLTEEELFMKTVLASKSMQARARLLIMEFVGMLTSDQYRTDSTNKAVPEIDAKNTTVN